MKRWYLIQVDLGKVHFCRDNKVRYRKHLTIGMLLSTVLCIIGTAYGINWMMHAGTVANSVTALMWIWE